MTNDFRTPVGVISEIADVLMQSGTLSKETAEGLGKIRKNCDLLMDLINDAPPVSAPQESVNSGDKAMHKMIFIVDDNDSNLTMAASILENEYKILTMLSAVKMFSLLEKKQPDMILLDIEMPEMTGFEAIAKLKENPRWKDIPVIFLTGHEDESILSSAKEKGAVDVIQKPILPAALRECAAKYIGG